MPYVCAHADAVSMVEACCVVEVCGAYVYVWGKGVEQSSVLKAKRKKKNENKKKKKKKKKLKNNFVFTYPKIALAHETLSILEEHTRRVCELNRVIDTQEDSEGLLWWHRLQKKY